MRILKTCLTVKPIQYFSSLDFGCFSRYDGIVSGVRPIAKIVYKSVFLWVPVDIGGEVNQVAVIIDNLAFERFLEQAASSFVSFIECF